MNRWVAIIALLGAVQALNLRPDQHPSLSLAEHQSAVPESYAHKDCLSANDNRKALDKEHFESRNSLLQKVQPWKYEPETLKNYQEDPKIKKVYYINNGDGRRLDFMEKALSFAEKIPHEKFQGVTRGEVEAMQVNGGVPQEAWNFAGGGMAQYLKDTRYDDVVGTVGVYLSHAKLMEKIQREDGNSTDIYAIMEDDTALDPNWDANVLEAVKTLPPDWDIARFVYWGGKRCEDAVPSLKEGQTKTRWYEALEPNSLNDVNMYGGNQGYLIRAKSVEHIFKKLRELPVMDFDGAVGSNHKLYQEDGGNVVNEGLYTYVIDMPVGHHEEIGGSGRILNDMLHPRGWSTQGNWGEDGAKKAATYNPFANFR